MVQSLQSLCLYSGCSGISHTSTEPDPGWPPKTVTAAIKVICGWSVARMVFYDVIITVRRCQSVRRLLVANLSQTSSPDTRPGTWLSDYALTLWGPCGEGCYFCVWIIRNCCPNYWRRKKLFYSTQKIMFELLERSNYWSGYGNFGHILHSFWHNCIAKCKNRWFHIPYSHLPTMHTTCSLYITEKSWGYLVLPTVCSIFIHI